MNSPSRNDPCPCGSGKKYKKCCLAAAQNQPGDPVKPSVHPLNPKNAAPPPERLLHALALHQDGRLDEAEAAYRSLLQENPANSDALHYLGLISFRRGEYADAARLIEQAIKLNGNIPAFHFNLGNTCVQLNQLDPAADAYRKATQLDPGFLLAHLRLGGVLKAQGKLDAAITCYRKIIALKPDHADAHNNLGLALQAQGKLDAAAEEYRKAISAEPGFVEAHVNLGNTLKEQGKTDEAIGCYRKVLALRPDYADAHVNLGNALRETGQLEEAGEHYRQALALKPDCADAHAGLAYLNLDFGKFADAQAALRMALECRPEHPIAWAMLASLRKMTPADESWLNTALRLASRNDPALSGREAYTLWFAIGKYYDDTAQYDLAFPAFSQANRIKRQTEGGFDRAGFARLVDELIATFTAEFVGRQREGASPSRRPVLVVGMPRSGTSLIEQIIASHPLAFGAGELTFWGRQTGANDAVILSGNYGPALIARIAGECEQHLQCLSGSAARIVDKMPDNFLRLGFIATVFPHARFIHSLRNPVDTCLSIHFQNFASGHSYGTDLEDLAFYYREYDRLMRHWRKVLPCAQLLDVPYEALVDDQAGWSRRMIEFIGLDWDERCLDFHETERTVGTASNWQVRQKIYRTSKARWRNYEKHLGPLLGLLDLGAATASM
ncbi:MAG: tetratricopeptide repeat protein [Nitrosomonadales bacterium]|nr:tetratricopeptide repeat protein [Nitrosomonadales bacterium]